MELKARQDIHDLLVRACRGVDRLDRELIVSCYHPDAIDRHGAFNGSPGDFADWVIERHTGNISSCMHHIANEYVEIDGDSARSETCVVVYYRFEKDGEPYDMLAPGRYLDRLTRRNGQWKIQDRLVLFEKDRLDPVKEISVGPLTEKLVRSRRDREDPSYELFPALSA